MSETIAYAPEIVGALPLATEVNAVVGSTPAVLTMPAGARFLTLMADVGGWRVRRGSVAGAMPATEHPAAAVTDGSGGIYVSEGNSVSIPAKTVTVAGYAANSVLTYFWS